MDEREPLNTPNETQSITWRERLRRAGAQARKAVPFVMGVLASLAALLLYNTLFPPPQPMTSKEVNDTVAAAMASATPPPAYSAQVYQQIIPSLVLIQSEIPGAESDEVDRSLGSGVVVSNQGDILTSLHVVEGARDIKITFADGTESPAVTTAEQPESDIAVLRALQPPPILIPAILGNPGAMNVGDEAFVVGNPFGLYGSMSTGVISGFERSFQSPNHDQRLSGLIQFDTAVNPGNSGGPLLNRDGHVVGIVVGILNPTEDDFFIGIGFAVPINIAGGAAGSPPY